LGILSLIIITITTNVATPQAMTDDEITKQHLTLSSKYFPRRFEQEFPGLKSSPSQRRSIQVRLCKWYNWQENFEATKGGVYKLAKDTAAEVLIEQLGETEIKTSFFRMERRRNLLGFVVHRTSSE
jgi:hypothetical protein